MSPEMTVVILAHKIPHGQHERPYNPPTAAEVTIITFTYNQKWSDIQQDLFHRQKAQD